MAESDDSDSAASSVAWRTNDDVLRDDDARVEEDDSGDSGADGRGDSRDSRDSRSHGSHGSGRRFRRRGEARRRKRGSRRRNGVTRDDDDDDDEEEEGDDNVRWETGSHLLRNSYPASSSSSFSSGGGTAVVDPRFAPREKWVRGLYLAIRRGNLARVEQVLGPRGEHPSAINFQMFNMGFPVGGGTVKLPASSTALHVAAWCGQGDIVRWLLNHGARSDLRDGLHQLPVEVASTLDCKRALGAATGIVDLSDKVEQAQMDISNGILAVGDRFQIKLARIQAELGEIDYKIETSVREAAREEVLELRAALARKLARELQRYERRQGEIKTDPMVWEKIADLAKLGDAMKEIHREVDELREQLDNRAIDFDIAARVGEVESTATPGGHNDSRDVRKLTKQVDKMASSLRKKNGEIDQLTDDLEQLTRRLAKLELQARAPKGGCCVVM